MYKYILRQQMSSVKIWIHQALGVGEQGDYSMQVLCSLTHSHIASQVLRELCRCLYESGGYIGEGMHDGVEGLNFASVEVDGEVTGPLGVEVGVQVVEGNEDGVPTEDVYIYIYRYIILYIYICICICILYIIHIIQIFKIHILCICYIYLLLILYIYIYIHLFVCEYLYNIYIYRHIHKYIFIYIYIMYNSYMNILTNIRQTLYMCQILYTSITYMYYTPIYTCINVCIYIYITP